jgi:antitoxin (DNA-binding transcriptional repressor) of toxin-antitoxin stability system
MIAVGIRELKNRLSEYLRMVRRGEEILVTDRGEVIAELRQPRTPLSETPYPGLLLLAQRGKARLGARNRPDLYPPLDPLLPGDEVKRLLEQERGER